MQSRRKKRAPQGGKRDMDNSAPNVRLLPKTLRYLTIKYIQRTPVGSLISEICKESQSFDSVGHVLVVCPWHLWFFQLFIILLLWIPELYLIFGCRSLYLLPSVADLSGLLMTIPSGPSPRIFYRQKKKKTVVQIFCGCIGIQVPPFL